MYKHVIFLLSSSLLLCPLSLAQTTTDFQQPITVDAKSQFVDGKNKTSLFKDDVHIVQGTLVIDASEVEVIASEGDGKEVFVARGAPAKYSQQLEDGTTVSASAEEIRYEVQNKTISLRGQAELKQAGSMVAGNSIVYDMRTQQLLATGGDNEENSRVTTVFRPESIKKNDDKQQSPEPPR